MQKKMLQIVGLSILVGVTLTGCQAKLPAVEEEGLKVFLEWKKGHAEEVRPLPPGLAKKVVEKEETVTIVGALVHPEGAKNPFLLNANGQSYELVKNHTSYDIRTIRKTVPYLMVKLVITDSNDGKVQKAELREVITEGIALSGKMNEYNGKFKFKHKNKNNGNNGKGKDKKNEVEREYEIVENHSGVQLTNFKDRDNYYFFKVVGEVGGVLQVSLYAIY